MFGKFGFLVFLLSFSLSLLSLAVCHRGDEKKPVGRGGRSATLNLTPLHLCPNFRWRKGEPMGRAGTGG